MIKLCGMTREQDLENAAALGVDFFGVVIGVGWSKRSCSVASAKALFAASSMLAVPGAALFCNSDLDFVVQTCRSINPFAVQLQGEEPPAIIEELKKRLPCQVWKAVHVAPKGEPQMDSDTLRSKCLTYQQAGASVIILDTLVRDSEGVKFGGTGAVGDWETARKVIGSTKGTFFLAGGLAPDNCLEAIEQVQPDGIDLASGIERSPGVKDIDKMQALVEKVRNLKCDES